MTETKQKKWMPQVGSLVVINETGCSGRVFETEGGQAYDQFYVRLESDLYLGVDGGQVPVAKKGESVIFQYEPRYHDRDSVSILHNEGDWEMHEWAPGDHARDKWLLVRHPNDGAPKTNRFQFNHWACWDDGKHESFDPEWRGGHNYAHGQQVACADVKIRSNPLAKCRDRAKMQDIAGYTFGDGFWCNYITWLDAREEKGDLLSNDEFDYITGDAARSLKDVLDGTGLEFGFYGRSGGWFGITNAGNEGQWGVKALNDEEQNEYDDLSLLRSNEMTDEQAQRYDELYDRAEGGFLCDGDKAVVRAVLHLAETHAEGEIEYQSLSLLWYLWAEYDGEHNAVLQEKKKRNDAREDLLAGINAHHSWPVKVLEKTVAAIIALDSNAPDDGWDWNEKFCDDECIEEE